MAETSIGMWARGLLRLAYGVALIVVATVARAQDVDRGDADAFPENEGAQPRAPADPVDEVPAAAPLPANRFEAEILMQELIEAEDFAAAAALADHLLDLTAEEFGADSEIFADTLIQVAAAQSRNGDYDLAEENALLAIESLRDAAGIYAPALVDPYLVLGDNYYASGDAVSAMSAYNEARTISRRVYGLLNEGQIDIIDRLSEVAEESNQFAEAQALQLQALTLIERSYELHSHEVLAALYKYARWLREKSLFTDEREQYRRAERIIRDNYGEQSLELVELLRLRANSFRTQGAEESAGISGLRDALEIVSLHDDPLARAEVLRDLGDWEVAFSRLGSDGASYLEAWDLLGSVEDGAALRLQWFEETTIVFTAPFSRRGLSTNPQDPWGNVVLRFIVDTSGRTSDVEVIESDPPGLKDEAFARQFRQSRFRPLVRDGELLPVRRAFDIKFQYEPLDVE